MKRLILLILLSLAPGSLSGAAGAPAHNGLLEVRVCDGAAFAGAAPAFNDAVCPRARPVDVDPQGRLIWVRGWLEVPPLKGLNGRPTTLRLSAMASSEIYWNGTLVGRNGRPAAVKSAEQAGRIDTVFYIPPELVRQGPNLLAIRLSSHHGGLRVRRPVHAFYVAPGADSRHGELARYTPALVALGALLVTAFYFGGLWWSQRSDRASLLLGSAALAACGQLVAEVTRALVSYPYPLHLVRMGAIIGFATAFGLLLVAFAAERYAPSRRKLALGWAAAGCAVAVLVTPGFDVKAIAVVLLSSLAASTLAFSGLREGRKGAGVALAGLAAFPVAVLLSAPRFLDQTYYVALAGLALLLFASQVIALRREQREREEARGRAARLELELLKRHLRRLVVTERGRRHIVNLPEVVCIRGADDYVELELAGGGTRLHDETLTSLAKRLPDTFLRVHRSIIVNLDRVQAFERSGGGGAALTMSDGSSVPVGRSYLKLVRQAIGA